MEVCFGLHNHFISETIHHVIFILQSCFLADHQELWLIVFVDYLICWMLYLLKWPSKASLCIFLFRSSSILLIEHNEMKVWCFYCWESSGSSFNLLISLRIFLQDSDGFISSKSEELLRLMVGNLPSCHFSAKRHRLDCLYFLIVHVSKVFKIINVLLRPIVT